MEEQLKKIAKTAFWPSQSARTHAHTNTQQSNNFQKGLVLRWLSASNQLSHSNLVILIVLMTGFTSENGMTRCTLQKNVYFCKECTFLLFAKDKQCKHVNNQVC